MIVLLTFLLLNVSSSMLIMPSLARTQVKRQSARVYSLPQRKGPPHSSSFLSRVSRAEFIGPYKEGDLYRVTIHVVPDLTLTSKQKLRFSMRPMYKKATFVLVSRGGLDQRDVSEYRDVLILA